MDECDPNRIYHERDDSKIIHWKMVGDVARWAFYRRISRIPEASLSSSGLARAPSTLASASG